MQDVVLAVAFLAMILSPCAFSLFRQERNDHAERANGEMPNDAIAR